MWDYWDPFAEIERIRKRIQKLMQRFGETFEEETRGFPLDISETDDEVIVRASLPGFNKDEISIKATENSLDISAQHKKKKIEKTENIYKEEKRFGGVRRYVTLPTEVKTDGAEANFESGVLTVKLKKARPKKKAKAIEVK